MSRLVATATVTVLMTMTATGQQAPVRDVRTAAPTGTAAIIGTTVSDAPGNPAVPFAQVGILGLDSGVIRVTSSDGEGRFQLANLPPGRYLVSGLKPPFVGAIFGARQSGRAGTPIAVTEGEQRTGVVLRLTRGSVITGIVNDEFGQPAADVTLMLTTAAGGTLQQQVMTMAFTPPQVTDDRGMYRFSGLPPGEYLITAMHSDRFDRDARVLSTEEVDAALRSLGDAPPAPPASSQVPPTTVVSPTPVPPTGMNLGSSMPGLAMLMAGSGGGGGYSPVYYPGTVDASEAQPVRVAAGEEREGIDLVARRVPTSRIQGQVIGIDGQPATGAQLRLLPVNPGEIMSLPLMAVSSGTRVGSDGRFTMDRVPPGRYTLEARTFAQGGSPIQGAAGLGAIVGQMPRAQHYASVDVTVVSHQPTTGVELRVQSGSTIAGRLIFNATTLERPKDFSNVMVTLTPASQADLFLGLGGGANFGRIAEDGTFTIEGVVPGRYLITATVSDVAQLLRWMPSSVVVAGREMTDLPVDVKPGEDIRGVAVTLTDAQQEVSGTLQDASGRPAPDFTILLFPADRAYWFPNSRRVLAARPGTDGFFAFKGPLGPPPGEYLLAAVTDLAPEDQYKPTFLAEVAKAAIPIRVAAGQVTRQDVRISR